MQVVLVFFIFDSDRFLLLPLFIHIFFKGLSGRNIIPIFLLPKRTIKHLPINEGVVGAEVRVVHPPVHILNEAMIVLVWLGIYENLSCLPLQSVIEVSHKLLMVG
jgi:hypothetical protein